MFGAGLLSAELSGNNTTFNYGPDTPDPDNQDKPWFKTDANYQPERWYTYSNGAWVARHPDAPGQVIMYRGSEASIETFDGGEAGAITATTGPMWQKVAAMDAKMPIGPGTLPSGATLNVGDTGGEEKHTIARNELPNIQLETESVLRNNVEASSTGDAPVYSPDTTTGSFVSQTPLMTESLNGDATQVAGNNLPPYVAIWFIERTARLMYRV